MENEMEEEFSFFELWSAIKKRLWLVVGIAAAVTVAAVLVLWFVINPRMERYRMEFSLSYIGSSSGKYPDGSPFYVRDFISSEYLERAKASDAGFSQIDVKAILDQDGIGIEYDAATGRYSLSINRSYFESSKQATDFLRAVAEVPATVVKEKIRSGWQMIDEDIYRNASFEDKLALLASQRDSLLGIYDSWIGALNENYTVGGKTLKVYRTEAAVIFGDALRESLTQELKKYGYKSLKELPVKLAELQAEKTLNESKLENLNELLARMLEQQETATSAESVSEMIAGLIVRNLEIDNELEWLVEENILAFGVRIDTEYKKLVSAGEALGNIAKALYENETRTFFYASSVETEGGFSLTLISVGTFAAVFLIAGAFVAHKGMAEKRAASLKESENKA